MEMSTEEQIYALLVVAKEQQAAVDLAVKGIQTEQARLANARERAEVASRVLRQTFVEDRSKLEASIKAIETTVERSVKSGVQSSMPDIAKSVEGGVYGAANPVMQGLSRLVGEAAAAEGRIARAGRWFSWKVFALAGCCVLWLGLVGWWSVWWERDQVDQLSAQKEALRQDIAGLQAGVAELEKKGGRIKFGHCGPAGGKERLCIEIDRKQGGAERQRDFEGSWNNANGQQFVIPKGY